MRRVFLAVVAALAATPNALPNDTMLTLAAGGLIPLKTARVALESEDLEISSHRVTVTYRFQNQSAADIDAIVGFPLPALNGGDVENVPMSLPSKDPVNFIDFQVTADGRPVKADVETRAFVENREITGQLRRLGLSASVLEVRASNALRRLTAAERAALRKDEWIECDDARGDCAPMWQTRIQYYWKQHFPAGRTVVVRHSYRPVVGGSYLVASMDGASNIRPYCGGSQGLGNIAALKKRYQPKSQDDIVLWEDRIDYILTTANNWSGPIRKFHLAVTTDSPEDLMFTCMPGLKPTSPTRYEMERTDFHPDQELKLLILTRKNRTPDTEPRP
jgi:hypothetical protein